MESPFLASLISISSSLQESLPSSFLSDHELTEVSNGLYLTKLVTKAIAAATDIFDFYNSIVSIAVCTGEYGPELESRALNIASSIPPNLIVVCDATEAISSRSLPANSWFKDLGSVSMRDMSRERLYSLQRVGTNSMGLQFELVRNRLPNHKIGFIGRKTELSELIELTDAFQWINIVGPFGIGKSALCLTLAKTIESGFPDGVHWINCRKFSNFESFIKGLGVALGVGGNIGVTQIENLVHAIGDSRPLIVLDNCSPYREELGNLCESLIRSCPSVVLVTTCISSFSREGEYCYDLAGLSLPNQKLEYLVSDIEDSDAIEFFLDQAEKKGRKIKLSATNIKNIVNICWRLGGSPLGIDLVTNRIGSFPLKSLLKELDTILLNESSTPTGEESALRDSIEWTLASLSKHQIEVITRLSFFQGRFTLEGARTLCSNESQSLGIQLDLSALVDLSLLEFSQETQTFSVNSLIRIHFQNVLKTQDTLFELETLYMITMSKICEDILTLLSSSFDDASNQLTTYEQDLKVVITLALKHSDTWAKVGDLVTRLFLSHWSDRQVPTDREDLMKWVINETNPTPRMKTRMLVGLGNANYREKNYTLCVRYYEEALLTVPRDIPMAVASVLSNYAITLANMNKFDQASAMHEELLPYVREGGSLIQICGANLNYAYCLIHSAANQVGEARNKLLIQAETLLDQAESSIENKSSVTPLQQIYHNRGDIMLLRGNLDEAERHFLKAISVCCERMILHQAFQAIEQLADISLRRKNYKLAALQLGNSVSHSVRFSVSRSGRMQVRFVEMMDELRSVISESELQELLAKGAELDLQSLFEFEY